MNLKRDALVGLLLCLAGLPVWGQGGGPDSLRVLFIGNSYTATYNVPGLVSQIAVSTGRHLDYTTHNPGGTTFEMHFQNATVQQLLAQPGWDAIVLQEQSQVPVIPYFREAITMPFGDSLAARARVANPCARIMLFVTWGRQNGGQQCVSGQCSAPFANFDEYQDTLTWAYERLADSINAELCPVGEAWRASLALDPSILLHSADQSHQSAEGAHLAAAAFYVALFQDSAIHCTWVPANITPPVLAHLHAVADSVYFSQQPRWQAHTPPPPVPPVYSVGNEWVNDTLWASVSWPVGTHPRPTVAALPAPWQVLTDTLAYWAAPDTGTHHWQWNLNYTPECAPATPTQVSDSAFIAADTVLSRENGFNPLAFSIYPNPATETVTIAAPTDGPITYTLLDATGRAIVTGAWPTGGHNQLNVAHLSPGLYAIRVQTATNTGVRQVVVGR